MMYFVSEEKIYKGSLEKRFPALKCACQPGLHIFMITSSKAEKPDHGKPFLERGK
jgi:hypothetical protein